MSVDLRRRIASVAASLRHESHVHEEPVQDEEVLERIRRGYHALGFGADADVLAMLDQDGPEPACWQVHTLDMRRVRSRPAREVAALDLFGGRPPQFELARVQVRSWAPNERRGRLVVGGSYRLRVRGTTEVWELPFSHIWSFENGRVTEVRNLTEAYELRRLPAGTSCTAA